MTINGAHIIHVCADSQISQNRKNRKIGKIGKTGNKKKTSKLPTKNLKTTTSIQNSK
jgi:hypothetical protein